MRPTNQCVRIMSNIDATRVPGARLEPG
jgi:hypothetical protein